ncbi:MAG: HDOD domain-containing protein [Gammaproteobacteria bacterium]|nr:HDOD domain-containing protein [Gammaproteobacteria bacterium]MBU1602199.1 HDOD domain-containing protein [Gammaproteobacteria bacterium]MBU2434246.1 HDOD domain-containing protein [Gammaproteobacteria bacterium]MBU2448429.1 HDOD domain-containing protein [Gammaproteobacteria bacterium]
MNNIAMMIACSENDRDKKGEALKSQRFQMLADIAKELSGEVVFPTYFDAVLRIRKVLHDPEQSIANIARAVAVEPLISAKLLHLANSVAFNPDGRVLVDLKSAITRLGLNAVRTAALSIVMTQLMRAKGMADFSEITHSLWDHSINCAAAAHILARQMTRQNPDEAMLAGLIHDLGAFYMLYRATQYEELRHRPDSVKYLIIQWHESIGVSLLNALGLPEEIVEATIDHDHMRPTPTTIRNLGDVIYIANMLSGGHFEWLMQDQPETPAEMTVLEEKYGHLRPEIEALANEMRSTFA